MLSIALLVSLDMGREPLRLPPPPLMLAVTVVLLLGMVSEAPVLLLADASVVPVRVAMLHSEQ